MPSLGVHHSQTDIPDDVMWPLMDGKHIVSVPHHDRLLVDGVNDGLDEEIDGMAADCNVGEEVMHWTGQRGK